MSNLTNPLTVSVVMITYNHEQYIREAIEGVLMQECDFEIELILADDKSPDYTENIVKDIIKNHPKGHWIKYTRHTINKGMMPNFIWALNQCKGKYIALCEGDDYWTDPLKLQKQVDFLEGNEEYGLVYTDVDFYYQSLKKTKHSVFKNNIVYQSKGFTDHLVNRGYLAPLTWLFRKDLYDEFIDMSSSAKNGEGSFVLMLEFMLKSKVYYLDQTTATYRISDNSASRQNSLENEFKYKIGVFNIQREYLERYVQSNSVNMKILSGGYLQFYPYALELNVTNLIEECEEFFDRNNIDINPVKHLLVNGVKYSKIKLRLKKLKFSSVYIRIYDVFFNK